MDFSFSETQIAIGELAAQIFAGEVTDKRVAAASEDRAFDDSLWAVLVASGLLGVGVSEDRGGIGGAAVEMCQVLVHFGRSIASVPLDTTLCAVACLDRWEADATLVAGIVAGAHQVTIAAESPAGSSWLTPQARATMNGDTWTLTGWFPNVVGLVDSQHVLVPAHTEDGPATFLVDLADPSASIETVAITSNRPAGHLTLDAATQVVRVGDGDTNQWTWERLALASSAVMLGVADEAVRRAALYVSERHQFGRPLSSFQSTAHRVVDASIDVRAIESTLWKAAWHTDFDDDQTETTAALHVARWWAAEAGQRAAHAVQHVHGGIGADTSYPIHRYFLWAKQLELSLGAPGHHLEALGDVIAEQAKEAAASGAHS